VYRTTNYSKPEPQTAVTAYSNMQHETLPPYQEDANECKINTVLSGKKYTIIIPSCNAVRWESRCALIKTRSSIERTIVSKNRIK
jgi:hypothetical protein